jgi:hypothetical protein
MSENEISYPMDQQQPEAPRLSNGARAARIAAEHFTELEQVNEKLRATIQEMGAQGNTLRGQLMEQAEQLTRVERERDYWLQRATTIAKSVELASAAMLDSASAARTILDNQGPHER